MIETFVRQRFVEPDEWFEKVPGYLRQGTNPSEKARYLDLICDIVGRLNDGENVTGRADRQDSADANADSVPDVGQGQLPAKCGGEPTASPAAATNDDEYLATNFSLLGLRLVPRV